MDAGRALANANQPVRSLSLPPSQSFTQRKDKKNKEELIDIKNKRAGLKNA